tara:strand:+ start:304 stop:1698 length:1395 start_codon:yes stop_codon:yes gene_type:complete
MANSFTQAGDYFISAMDGNDSNAGTADAPFKTITAAVSAVISAGDTTMKKIIIGTGVYNENVISSSTSYRFWFIGDGNATLNGEGLGLNYGFYNCYAAYIQNLTFRNYYYVSSGNTNASKPSLIMDCTILGLSGAHGYNTTSYRSTYTDCTFVDYGGAMVGSYFTFNDCMFYNSVPMNNTSRYYCGTNRCIWYSTTNGTYIAAAMRRGSGFDNSFFSPGALWKDYEYSSGTYYPVQTFTDGWKELGVGLGTYSNSQKWRSVSFTMSMNDNLSGSDSLSRDLATFTADNAPYFNSDMLPQQKYQANMGPATSFGYNADSTNILHTDGGATWTNITESGAGFYISGSGSPSSGSITTTVLDLGASLPIRRIGFNWRSTDPNTMALATYPSGALNHTPVKYQYELKYGNSTPISTDYKLFELGTQPKVDTNGTGSGQPGFDSGSLSPIAARYLQFKLTLRNNISGSS